MEYVSSKVLKLSPGIWEVWEGGHFDSGKGRLIAECRESQVEAGLNF